MADPITERVFVQPDRQTLCLAVERAEATASVNDLSIDPMDVSAAPITAIDWKIGGKFTLIFDSDGDAMVETQKSKSQVGFFSLNLPPLICAILRPPRSCRYTIACSG